MCDWSDNSHNSSMSTKSSSSNEDELHLSWQHDPHTFPPEESDDRMVWRRENEGSRGSAQRQS